MEMIELEGAIIGRLKELGIDFVDMAVDGDGAVTIEDCAEVERQLGVPVVKSLLVSNRQGTRFHMVLMPAHKPFVTRSFSAARGVSRVSFVKPEVMSALVATPVGGCGPLSAIADDSGKVEVCVDGELSALDRIAVPAGTPKRYVALRLADILERYLPSTHHQAVVL